MTTIGPITGRVLVAPRSARAWGEIANEVRVTRANAAGPQWYLAAVLAGSSDKHACHWLKERGIEFYYPMLRTERRVARRALTKAQRRAGISLIESVLKPMFPRYVFTKIDRRDEEWRRTFEIAGVGGLVSYDGPPTAFSEEGVAKIRGGELDGAIPALTIVKQLFGVGERIEIAGGPFAGSEARIARAVTSTIGELDSDERIVVAVALFGRRIEIDIPFGDIATRA